MIMNIDYNSGKTICVQIVQYHYPKAFIDTEVMYMYQMILKIISVCNNILI